MSSPPQRPNARTQFRGGGHQCPPPGHQCPPPPGHQCPQRSKDCVLLDGTELDDNNKTGASMQVVVVFRCIHQNWEAESPRLRTWI